MSQTNSTTFNIGDRVEYRQNSGYVNFICDDYITICYNEYPLSHTMKGYYQSLLLVYCEYWNEVRSCVVETKEEQELETTSYFLQSRGCDYVGAAC